MLLKATGNIRNANIVSISMSIIVSPTIVCLGYFVFGWGGFSPMIGIAVVNVFNTIIQYVLLFIVIDWSKIEFEEQAPTLKSHSINEKVNGRKVLEIMEGKENNK